MTHDERGGSGGLTLASLASATFLHRLTGHEALADDAREIIVATGTDRIRFLNGIVTGNVAGTAVGAGCRATLLTVKAHVTAEMRIFPRANDALLVVPKGLGESTATALSRYAIMDDFAAAPTPSLELFAILGPESRTHLAAAGYDPHDLAGAALWSHRDVEGPAGPLWMARVHSLGMDGYWIAAAADVVDRLAKELTLGGLATLSPEAANVARVVAFEPVWGKEITEDYFPMEVGLGDAIDYKKGCFLGQEPIVRIRDRGHLNRRLVQLEMSDARVPEVGAAVASETKPKAGTLTSVARVAANGTRVLALGIVHVSAPLDGRVRVDLGDGTTIEARIVRE